MSTPATERQAPPTGHYAIDPASSSVTFVTRHMFGLARVCGMFAVTRGELTVAELARADQASRPRFPRPPSSSRNFMRDLPGAVPAVPRRRPPPGHCVPLHQRPAQRQRLDGGRRAHREGTACALRADGHRRHRRRNRARLPGNRHRRPVQARDHDDARDGGTPSFRRGHCARDASLTSPAARRLTRTAHDQRKATRHDLTRPGAQQRRRTTSF